MVEINLDRIKRCVCDARNGRELTIGFFGGSITQGSLATDHTRTYAYQVFRWWEQNFPQAAFHYVNGGIGGTSSHFGTARVVKDLLIYQPDFVVVDFSVNDDEKDGAFFQETFEGVIRRILNWPSQPGVVVLNNVYYNTGRNVQEYHNAVADYYGISHVSIKDTIYQQVLKGVYTREELTPDDLHPNDKGHRLVAAEICKFLDEVKRASDLSEEEMEIIQKKRLQKEIMQAKTTQLPAPITANFYEYAKRLTIENCMPKLDGFQADPREKLGHLDFFKNGWIGKKTGERIVFQVRGSCLAVQYRKTIDQPSPIARAVIDGNQDQAVILDGNFEETWGDCLYLQKLLHHGEDKVHTVEIEIIKASEEDRTPFYLLSLITA